MTKSINSIRNLQGQISGNIHSFAVESFAPLPGNTLATIFIGFDELNGKQSAELNFSREPQTSSEVGGVLHLFFPSEMMQPILTFLQNTVSASDPSFAVIHFLWDPSSPDDNRLVIPSSISLVDRRWCR